MEAEPLAPRYQEGGCVVGKVSHSGWPRDVQYAKAVVITEATARFDAPMSFRIVSVLCLLCRVWAKRRLEDLRPWVVAWATEDMFALSEHTDATMAWYRSSPS